MNIYCSPRSGQSGREAVYALLEYAVNAEYGIALPRIEKTHNGKPYFPDMPEIHFSLSHAATHVLCAVARLPVGADIESPRTVSERAIKYYCSSEELALFDPLDLWVLKESHVKLVGGTLALIKHIRFSRTDYRIIAPDENETSKLYHIECCRAAISTYGDHPPDSITMVPTPSTPPSLLGA